MGGRNVLLRGLCLEQRIILHLLVLLVLRVFFPLFYFIPSFLLHFEPRHLTCFLLLLALVHHLASGFSW